MDVHEAIIALKVAGSDAAEYAERLGEDQVSYWEGWDHALNAVASHALGISPGRLDRDARQAREKGLDPGVDVRRHL